MCNYVYEMYQVIISFTNHLGKPDQLTFEVLGYSVQEAEDKALEQFSEIVEEHKGTLSYNTEPLNEEGSSLWDLYE